MTATLPARNRATGARPAESPAARKAWRLGRIKMVAACYLGLSLLVTLSVIASRVWPSGAVAPLFILGMVGLIAAFHPRVRVTARGQ